MNRSQFVAYLRRKTLLSETHEIQALHLPDTEDICCYGMMQGWFDAKTLATELSKDFALPLMSLPNTVSDLEQTHQQLILKYKAIPLMKRERCYLVMADPNKSDIITLFTDAIGEFVQPALGFADQIQRKCAQLSASQLEDVDNTTQFIDTLFQQAILEKASDIHLESSEEVCRIRFRIDGLLQLKKRLPIIHKNHLINRIKILANLDISEHRLPQDGQLHVNDQLSCRVSICPTVEGEKVVLRLLKTIKTPQLNELGMLPEQQADFLKAIEKPQGLILVTGPTGSGKTVTLYSALMHLNSIHKNLCTVEDPVEMPLSGVNQLSIQTNIGLDFATLLKTLLRQDPDIMMIGEIRDSESAKIAIRAAQTGHLVLATLHANSAQETITRLQYMGISPDLIAYSLNLIVAQRLLRKLCQQCFGKCCDHCFSGYLDRMAVFECLTFDDAQRQKCLNNEPITPDTTLLDNAHLLLKQQLTNELEIQRVINT